MLKMMSMASPNGGLETSTSQSGGRFVISRKSSTVEIRAAAIHDVAGVHSETALRAWRSPDCPGRRTAHRRGHAGQQWLMREQGLERDRRGVELIEAALGLWAAKGRTTFTGRLSKLTLPTTLPL